METRRDIFHAIGDPTRRAILALIALQAMTPNAIAENFDVSRQAISRHMQVLTECDIVKQENAGREIYYHLNPKKIKEVSDWAGQFRQLWEGRFNAMEGLLNGMQVKKQRRKK